MIPLRDTTPSRSYPVVNTALIGINVAVFFYQTTLGAATEQFFYTYGMVPARYSDPRWGEYFGLGQQIFAFFSFMFLHGGLWHLIGNMWSLWIFGDNVEDAMGSFRFVLFYLLCGAAAAGLQVAANTESTIPMVGASGAIGGVMGAYVLLYPRVHVHLLIFLGFFVTTIAVPAVFMLGYWFLVQVLGGFSSIGARGGVAFWAHVGGFAAGALFVLLFRNPKLLGKHPYYGWKKRSPNANWRRIDRR